MATRQQHLKQWEHNRAFLASILHQDDNADWVTTVCFYTALQAVQVVLLERGFTRATTHGAREEILLKERSFKDIWPDYKALYDASRAARYDCHGWLGARAVREELIKNRLLRLEERCFRLAKVSVSPPDIFAIPYKAPANSGATAALAALETTHLPTPPRVEVKTAQHSSATTTRQ